MSYCFCEQLDDLNAQIRWLEAWGYTVMTRFWTRLVDLLLLLLGLAFLATWVALLVQEAQSRADDCSNWRENTCQGSMVSCNEEEEKLGNCALF